MGAARERADRDRGGSDRSRILGESRDESNPSWDMAGAVTVTARLALLVYTLVDANDAGWGSAKRSACGALSLALLASFVVIELTRRYPLIPFSIFKLRTFRGSNIIGLLLGMSLFAMFFFISLYMQQVLGYDPLKAGPRLPTARRADHRLGGRGLSWSRASASSPCS